jgi:hypothetical protein
MMNSYPSALQVSIYPAFAASLRPQIRNKSCREVYRSRGYGLSLTNPLQSLELSSLEPCQQSRVPSQHY